MATKKAAAESAQERTKSAAARSPTGAPTKAPAKPKPVKEKPLKIPSKIGDVADMLYETRQKRLELQRQVDAYAKFEGDLKNHLIDNLPKSSATGAAGKKARVQIVTEDVPAVQDWDATYKHIKKTGQFELLNRALNRSAVKERWDQGKEVPGVGHFTATKVSVTKV